MFKIQSMLQQSKQDVVSNIISTPSLRIWAKYTMPIVNSLRNMLELREQRLSEKDLFKNA